MNVKLRTSDEYAREFKLPACIGNKRFNTQVNSIQVNSLDSAIEAIKIQKNMQFPVKHAGWNSMCDDMIKVIKELKDNKSVSYPLFVD